ncbi:MAG: crotonase [Planctomycetota bacterium]|nr:MAG: crotonase [Planctomycetota bacterium]
MKGEEFDPPRNVEYENDDGIVVLTINRPEKLNALDNEVLLELSDCVDQALEDEDVAALVITGGGDKSFVAGADIEMLAEQGVLDGRENSHLGQQVFHDIENCMMPVIAAVNGFALGGGCELALACDFRYASSNALFGLPEVGLGIVPGYGGTQRLPRLVGMGHALELIMSGGKIDAEEALRIGLVNKVFEPAALLDEAKKTARKIAQQGPLAVRMAKEVVRRGFDMTLEEGLSLEADIFGMISSTNDMHEGMTAFLEKRKPQFQGE